MTKFETIKPYWPLIVVILLAVTLPVVIDRNAPAMTWMHQSMGYFMVILGMLKVFDLKGFKKGFAKYDIVTQSVPAYGFIYPFVELGLGLLFLSQSFLIFGYVATAVVMTVGLAGIMRATGQGKKLNCACMGNVLAVPLSTVSKIENGSMIIMSVVMLVHVYL